MESPYPSATNGLRILILDDSNVIRSLLKITLQKAGYKVDSAETITGAEIFYRKNQYDLLILDYMLDIETTGFDFLQRIHCRDIKIPPVIMLSAEQSDSHQEEAKQLGIQAWMRKPFTPDSILKLITNVLNRHPNQTDVPNT